MTIRIVQTCNKCKTERELQCTGNGHGQRTFSIMAGGWRQLGSRDSDICPDCINTFVASLD